MITLFRKSPGLLTVLLVLFLFSPYACSSCAEENEHHILIYMICGDLETDLCAATNDIIEISNASRTLADSTILVHVGGCLHYWFPLLEDGYEYTLLITNGEVSVIETLQGSSIASEKALASFLDIYADDGDILVFWGHGCPGFDGIGLDERNDNDTLSFVEIRNALMTSYNHFEIIGFDACSTASFEAVISIEPYCEWMIASPVDETTSGWNYNVLLPQLLACQDDSMQIRNRTPLTVLNMDEFRANEEYISGVLQGCSSSAGIESLNNAITMSSNRTAARYSEDFLGGQVLLFSSSEPDDMAIDVIATEIAYEYQSFLNRK